MSSSSPAKRPSAGAASAAGPISSSTKSLVESMMKDAKLTPFQQRQLKAQLEKGTTLPKEVNPTSSRPAAVPAKPKPKPAPVVGAGGKRALKDIVASDAYKKEEYVPSQPGVDRDAERQKLHDVMAFGKDIVEAKQAIVEKHKRGATRQPEPAPAHDDDIFDIISEEIEDRRRFLEQMESLGRGKQYRAQIMTEISQKLRQLEVIDRERCGELQKMEEEMRRKGDD